MIKRLLRPLTFACFLLSAASNPAQAPQTTAREKQWQSYTLPSVEFSRQSDAGKTILFRAPATWERKPNELSFSGPYASSIKIFIEKVPDGIPLNDYVAAVTQQLRNQPGAEEMIVRRTQLSGAEAREIVLEFPDATGALSHRVIWCAVNGPNAISFVLITPSANTQEIEPYFKALIQSVNILGESEFNAFEYLRSITVKESKPARIDEVQAATATLNSRDETARHESIKKLVTIFETVPDSAIDLVIDRRTLVRAGAIEAISLSKNSTLDECLFQALDDKEAFVAERAARRIAGMADVGTRLKSHSQEWLKAETVARVWPFISANSKIEILRDIFQARPTISRAKATKPPAPLTPRPRSFPVMGTVTVTSNRTSHIDPSVQLTGLTLLRHTAADQFALPIGQIISGGDSALIRTALEVALDRGEKLPTQPLLTLLSSANDQVVKLAAQNLAQAGASVDIPRLEAEARRRSAAAGQTTSQTAVGTELSTAIQKIRLRDQFSAASESDRSQLMNTALKDPKLADWAWAEFKGIHDKEASFGSDQRAISIPTVAISPLADNVLPANVSLYAALPNPGELFRKVGSALNAIQMDTARQQADLVLIMNAFRQQLAAQLNVEPDAAIFDYLGVNGSAPAVFARWSAEGAPRGISSAERRALILRVTDRERFERLFGLYQRTIGDSEHLTEYINGAVRFLGLFPGAFPIAARAFIDEKLERPTDTTIVRLTSVGAAEWNGYRIKIFEQTKVDETGHLSHDNAYLTYVGETVVITPDMDSLRDLLQRLNARTSLPGLATNEAFKRSSQSGGDAIYFSNPLDLFASAAEVEPAKVTESGSLNISNSIWDNLFQLNFANGDWSKSLIPFKAADLMSPRDLLPSNTFGYFIVRIDLTKAWSSWKGLSNLAKQRTFGSIWTPDFEREVLPEIGSECGVAIVGVPSLDGKDWDVPLAFFCQLKSKKLGALFDNGQLFKGKVAASQLVTIKLDSQTWFASVRGSFLVLANSEAVMTALESKDKLAASVDFSKAAKRAPDAVVAFAGLNQDAAVSAIADSITDPEKRRQASAVLSIATAFHSQNFYATAESGAVAARLSTLIGREGRYSVGELSTLSRNAGLTFAIVEARGVPISNQEQVTSMRVRVRARAAGEIDRLVNDISSSTQIVNKRSENELELTVQARHVSPKEKFVLPITDAALAPFLRSTQDIRSDDPTVMAKAREIAGKDRDAWSVARKLSDWTFQNLKWKRIDYANAAQTLATREADCSEFSQLYVAMARALGLPARVVTGLAHSGSAFGAHAWVEVYLGEWIELDPTFGTTFVDATHIRDAAGGLVTYAALDLIELEVLEAPRGAAEEQRSARLLAEALCKELPKINPGALTAALDVSLITDEQMGKGSWAQMTDAEREQVTAAYRRIILELLTAFRASDGAANKLRLLRLRESRDRAEVLLMHETSGEEFLEKLNLAKRDNAWYLVEVLEADTGLRVIAELLKPAIWRILDQRSGKTDRFRTATNLTRVLSELHENPKAAAELADHLLKEEPQDRTLRYAQSLALSQDKKTLGAAIEIWTQLSTAPDPLPAAVLKLANHLRLSEKEEERQRALELYRKYVELEPDDPRGHSSLADFYDSTKDLPAAEAEYRAAVAGDASNTERRVDLIEFLALNGKYPQAIAAIKEARQNAADEDVLSLLFNRLMLDDDINAAESIARVFPQDMAHSATLNLYLGRMRTGAHRAAEALPLLRRAAELEKKSPEPYDALAECYRSLHNWPAAVSAANTAIDRDAADAEAYYQRACALARLGRIRDAITSLKKSVELDQFLAESIEEEQDLKPLASLPEFKKLVAERDKQ